MWCRRVCVAFVALFVGLCASAQIRIVPQSRLDSVANPTMVGQDKINIVGGAFRDFGTLQEDDAPWSATIKWQNVGQEPLVVTRVTTGCSCVAAEYQRSPIKAGEQGWVRVTFNPKDRVGGVMQRVYIYTNLSERTPSTIVTLRGRVESSSENEAYPMAMGDLRLGSRQVVVEKGRGGRVSIPCRNAGTKPLCVAVDKMFPIEGVSLRTEPEVLQPGAEGVLVVECEQKVDSPRRVYVSGVDVAPRNRTIDIVVE